MLNRIRHHWPFTRRPGHRQLRADFKAQALRDWHAALDDPIRNEGRINEARSRAVAYGARDKDFTR